jgi:hypothetical protein
MLTMKENKLYKANIKKGVAGPPNHSTIIGKMKEIIPAKTNINNEP